MLLWGAPQEQIDALTYDFCRPAFGSLQQPQHVQTPLPVYGRALPRLHVMAGPGPAAVKPMQLSEDEQRGFYSTYVDALQPAAQADLGFAPWRGCVVCWCCADESDGVKAARAARDSAQSADGFRQYLAAAQINVQSDSASCWPCARRFGELGVYRAVLPKSARLVTALPPRTGPMPLLQSSALPFDFDGLSFRARDEPFTGAFGAAMAAVAALMPARDLLAHITNGSYLSSRSFTVAPVGPGPAHGSTRGPASFADLVSSVVHHRLRQEFDTDHEQSASGSAARQQRQRDAAQAWAWAQPGQVRMRSRLQPLIPAFLCRRLPFPLLLIQCARELRAGVVAVVAAAAAVERSGGAERQRGRGARIPPAAE